MLLTDDACFDALCARDERFDGVFFTGVATTGIYCRPVCSARKPRRSSCRFYSTAAEAEHAGFRPCLRCRPELAPGAPGESLASALLHRLQERAVDGTLLADLDRDLGLSARQVRRILKEAFGISPAQVIQTQRLLLARQLLLQTRQPVGEVALAAGFRSLRRFNAAFAAQHHQAPTQLRRGKGSTAETGIHLRLSYRPPFAWGALLDYFRSRLVPGVESIVGDEYRRTVRLGQHEGWLRVQNCPDQNGLSVEVAPSLARVLGAIQWRVRRMFDLDAQPVAIATALGVDPLLGRVLEKHPGLRVGGAWDSFELAVRAVLGQQITVAAATTLSGRLVRRLHQPVQTPFDDLTAHAVSAEALLPLTLDELCTLGMVRARAETLRNLARVALDGGLEFPPGMDHEQVVRQLIAQPGIGPWTAHYIAMRALRYPDAFPAADLGLRKAIGKGEMITTRAAEQRAEAWRPWRAYAAAALWRSLVD